MTQTVKLAAGIAILIFCLAAPVARAHGVGLHVSGGAQGWLIDAHYDEDKPMAGAAVTIIAPKTDAPFQRGQTDQKGNFIFKPDRAGKWVVTVDDGTGHKLTRDVEIASAELAAAPAGDHDHAENADDHRVTGLLIGLGVIFSITIGAWGWSRYRPGNSTRMSDSF